MHDLLIENSPDLDKGSLERYAAKLGLDMDRFKADLEGMKHKAQIDADVQYAYDLDLYNTPTFFINGRIVVGNRPYEYLKKIVIEEIQNAR